LDFKASGIAHRKLWGTGDGRAEQCELETDTADANKAPQGCGLDLYFKEEKIW